MHNWELSVSTKMHKLNSVNLITSAGRKTAIKSLKMERHPKQTHSDFLGPNDCARFHQNQTRIGIMRVTTVTINFICPCYVMTLQQITGEAYHVPVDPPTQHVAQLLLPSDLLVWVQRQPASHLQHSQPPYPQHHHCLASLQMMAASASESVHQTTLSTFTITTSMLSSSSSL